MAEDKKNKKENSKKVKPRIVAVVASSDFNKKHFVNGLKNNMFSYIIAADGGYKHLEDCEAVPNLAIGDFDSLGYVPKEDKICSVQLKTDVDNKTLKPLRVMQYPVNKDKSDLELAIDEAIAQKPNLIMVYGALGKRLDHTISTTQMLSHCSDYNIGIFCIGSDYSCVVVKGPSEFGLGIPNKPNCDKTISVFSLTDVSLIEQSQGLKWQYVNTALTSSMSLGVSNEINSNQVKLKVKQGKVLMVFSSELL